MSSEPVKKGGFRRALRHGSIATAGKLVGVFALNKVLAVTGGGVAVAAVGQLQNVLTAGTAVTGAALANGVTTIAADAAEGDPREEQTLREATRLSLQGGAILLPLLVLMPLLLRELLPEGGGWLLSLLLVLAIFATGRLQIALALFNARRRLSSWSSLQLIAALIQPVAAAIGAVGFGLTGALTALLLANILPILLLTHKMWRLLPRRSPTRPERAPEIRHQLLGFGLVQAISLIAAPVSLTWIRQLLVSGAGWDAAGHWQALWRLSEISIVLLTATVTAHLLPEMAKGASFEVRASLLRHTLKRVAGLAALIAAGLFLFREQVLTLAFDRSFVAAAPAAGWQFAGDVIRMVNWCGGITLLARKKLFLFGAIEMISVAVLMTAAVVLIPRYGVVGAAMAHFAENGAMAVVLMVAARRAIR